MEGDRLLQKIATPKIELFCFQQDREVMEMQYCFIVVLSGRGESLTNWYAKRAAKVDCGRNLRMRR
jgi:hypothetical protein